MTSTLLAAVAAAGLLGATHAVEPDHVAGISAISSEYGDPRWSSVAGVCFALGHVALVVVWVVGGYLLLGRTGYPPLFEVVGTIGVGVVLGLFAVVTTASGIRQFVHDRPHEHDDVVHRHTHLHLLPGRSHDHGVAGLLKTGVVGALLTLSPPLTMLAFVTTMFPRFGPDVVALAIAAYAVTIVATMGVVGAGVGYLFGFAGGRSGRFHATLQVVTGAVIGVVAIAVASGAL